MSFKSVKNFICPVDKRRFATQAALSQHSATHNRGAKLTRRNAKKLSTFKQGRISTASSASKSVSGTDMIGLVELISPGTTGQRLLRVPINPFLMEGTRLQAEANLWSRWKPRKLVLRLVTSASSYVGGMYTLGWSADPEERTASGRRGVAKIATYRPHVTAQIYQNTDFSVPPETTQKWYLKEGKTSETTHGVVLGALAAPINNVTAGSTVSLYVHLDWIVEFSGPDMPSTTEEDTLYASDSYVPYFTDSVGDWVNGKFLTLKHEEGGGVVPFPQAMPGIVYKLDEKASLNYWVIAGGEYQKKAITHAVRIANYHAPALAVFPDVAAARKYARSGDANHCTGFAKAGDWITPSNPAWHTVDSAYLLDLTAPQARPVVSSRPHSLLTFDQQNNVDIKTSVADLLGQLKRVEASLPVIDTILGAALKVLVVDPVPLATGAESTSGEDEHETFSIPESEL